MTRYQFLKALKTAGIRLEPEGDEYIYVDDVLVLGRRNAYIEPNNTTPYFMTTCNETRLDDVTKKDIAKFVTYWRKFHKYNITDMVRRMKYDRPLGTLQYTTISGKCLTGEAAVNALKRDLRNGTREMERQR